MEYTVNWNLFAREFICQVLQMFEIAKHKIEKNPNGYNIVIIVVINFHKDFSVVKIFPSKVPRICSNIFQRKIIAVYSIGPQSTV